MLFIRSLIFNFCFIVATIIIATLILVVAVCYRPLVFKLSLMWPACINWLLKIICNITYEIRGLENIPRDHRYIFACKHQSAWETMMFQKLSFRSAIILKRELFWIPIFGQVIYLAHAIGINRNKGRHVMPDLIRGAQCALERGQSIFMFPEGTRSPAGKPGHYKRGVGQLYHQLDVPVVPAALNAGYFWRRRGFIKYPGHIVVSILPPIQPGLDIPTFMTHLTTVIEDACLTLPKPLK